MSQFQDDTDYFEEAFDELQDDVKRTMLMKHLFHQRFIDFTDDIMRIYYIWDKEQVGNQYGNLYQKMCGFIDSLFIYTGPLRDITVKMYEKN